jgi:hypothetical protein
MLRLNRFLFCTAALPVLPMHLLLSAEAGTAAADLPGACSSVGRRLLVLAKCAKDDPEVDTQAFHHEDTCVAASYTSSKPCPLLFVHGVYVNFVRTMVSFPGRRKPKRASAKFLALWFQTSTSCHLPCSLDL